jgi:hypothetical protein
MIDVLASTVGFVVRTAEYTQVTDLLDDPDDHVVIAKHYIEDLEERLDDLDLEEPVAVIAVERLTDDLNREELDYRLTLIVSPADYHRLDQGGLI